LDPSTPNSKNAAIAAAVRVRNNQAGGESLADTSFDFSCLTVRLFSFLPRGLYPPIKFSRSGSRCILSRIRLP